MRGMQSIPVDSHKAKVLKVMLAQPQQDHLPFGEGIHARANEEAGKHSA